MTRKSAQIPVIKLIGDPLENFYQLGLKDRDRHKLVLNHINSLIRTPWKAVDLVAGEVLKQILARTLATSPNFKRNLGAYAEGLESPFDEVAKGLLVPELLSFMSRWIPGLPTGLLGCSSYFLWDEDQNSPVHGRVLDFPLLDSYDKEERLLLTKFKGQPKIFSYGATGMPYPGLTAMNSEGVSLSLHQKFTDKLEQKGVPIFELMNQLMIEVGDKDSALNFLKKHKSITRWGINLCFKSGEVLLCDLAGDELDTELHQLEKDTILYTNNMSINTKLDQSQFYPLGLNDYNKGREEVALEKIDKKLRPNKLTDKNLLKVMATPLDSTITMTLRPDPATISSLGISTFSPGTGKVLIIPGEAPKYFDGQAFSLENIWENQEVQLTSISKTKTPPQYKAGMRHLMLAQVAFDRLIKQDIYHHLQMSIELLSGYPEKHLAEFYFLVFQFMEDKHEKVRSSLLDKFYSLEGRLTPYLDDNRKLFIYRLERLTGARPTVTKETISHPKLKLLLEEEEKLPNFLLHQTTTLLLNPRIDLWDIIHAHIKP